MKIGFTGIDLPEGKIKYIDENLNALVNKDNPRKVTPYYVKFVRDEFLQTEAIVVLDDSILDLLIIDMEKIEARLSRLDDGDEKKLWLKCLEHLGNERPLGDVQFTEAELDELKTMELVSRKPVYRATGDEDVNTIITRVFEQAGYIFFYTSWPEESHAWLIKRVRISSRAPRKSTPTWHAVLSRLTWCLSTTTCGAIISTTAEPKTWSNWLTAVTSFSKTTSLKSGSICSPAP